MTRNCLRPLATIVILALPAAGATIALQSFEESGDTWTYTPDPPEFYTNEVTWGVTNTLLTLSATDGVSFWGVKDLRAPGGTNGFGTLIISLGVE